MDVNRLRAFPRLGLAETWRRNRIRYLAQTIRLSRLAKEKLG